MVIAAVVGGAVVIVGKSSLNFSDYVDALSKPAVGVGLGIDKQGKGQLSGYPHPVRRAWNARTKSSSCRARWAKPASERRVARCERSSSYSRSE